MPALVRDSPNARQTMTTPGCRIRAMSDRAARNPLHHERNITYLSNGMARSRRARRPRRIPTVRSRQGLRTPSAAIAKQGRHSRAGVPPAQLGRLAREGFENEIECECGTRRDRRDACPTSVRCRSPFRRAGRPTAQAGRLCYLSASDWLRRVRETRPSSGGCLRGSQTTPSAPPQPSSPAEGSSARRLPIRPETCANDPARVSGTRR